MRIALAAAAFAGLAGVAASGAGVPRPAGEATGTGASATAGPAPAPTDHVPLARPVAFVRNDGQWDGAVRYEARRGGVHLFLLADRAEFRLVAHGADGEAVADALTMRWDGLGATRIVEGARAAGVRHFLRGNDPAAWRRNVPAFDAVRYEGRAAAIEFHGRGGPRIGAADAPIEYDVVVPPGGDASSLRITFEGAESVTIDPANGELVVRMAHGEMRQTAPVVWQETAQGRTPVDGAFVAFGGASVGFRVGRGDPSHVTRIDPAVRWSTYIGSTDDEAFGCAGLPAGASIVVGKTASFDHIVTPGVFQDAKRPAPPAAGHDCFVTKFNAAGEVVWSTYFGGTITTVEERALGVTVDDLGRPWFCGQTGSSDFPLRNALRTTFGGAAEAFVAALTSDGSDVYVSTYLGGSASEAAYSVARSPTDGTFAVAGGTSSSDFPAVAAADGTLGGGQDGFVARLSPDGRTLVSSTYLGGSGTDELRRVAHDAAGEIYVGGFTTSSGLATAGAAQTARGASTDGLVARMPADASRFSFITYLAGNSDDVVYGLAPTPAGNVAFCGQTLSANLPVTLDAADPDLNAQDGFLGLLVGGGTSFRYLSFVGGAGADGLFDLAILPNRDMAVAGRTRSPDFPLISADAFKAAYSPAGGASDTDGVFVRLDETGRALVYGSFFGGDVGSTDGGDRLNGVAVDGNGGIVVCGLSTASDFPLVSAARSTIAASPVGVSVAARLASDPTGTIALKKGTLFNSLSALGDRLTLKGKATLAAGTAARFSSRDERLSFAFGPANAAQFSVVALPKAKGYSTKSGGRIVRFQSRPGAKPVVKISLNGRTGAFALSATKFSFPAVPTTDLELTFIAGDDGFTDRRTWVDEGTGAFHVEAE